MDTNRIIATKDDWEISPMPEKVEEFKFKRHFTKQEIENLKLGHIPDTMEDRWFCYFEDNQLHIFRSWSGFCIYIVKFNFLTNKHQVIVNRDDSQYTNTDVNEDIENLNTLLGFWC